MHATNWRRTSSLLAAGALALAACQGEKGNQGPPGESGISTGTISGKLLTTGGAPVPNATVTTSPLGLTATSGADGSFSIAGVPIGTYSITISGTNVTSLTVSNVVVVAGATADVGTKTLAYTPIAIQFGAVPNPAGFGKTVSLSATVTGATGPLTYEWKQVSGPTAAAFSSTTVANPTFTTGAFKDVSAGVKFQRVPERPGVINFTAQQQTDATYKLRLTVSDGKYSQSKDLSLASAGWVQGSTNAGVGTMVVANDRTAASYAWTLSGPGSAALQDASTRNPWFIPDAAGTWTLTNGATSIAVKADSYVGATPNCGICHSVATADKVAAIWAEYQSSAHANFWWKDPTKTPKGIFAGGIDGEVSTYYNSGCPRCHTTGNDPTAKNGGFDEAGFVFPAVLKDGNFAALTDAQKKLGAITCESCHGPLAGHASTATNPPKAFFNAEACGYCHDSLSHHDRYNLWSQSGHANLGTALAENRSTCTRCHTAQGYAKWAASGLDSASYSITIGNNEVEPQTCQACHDPHTTRLRIDGSTPINLPAGYTVGGAGSGALCMSCHNTRNGAHGDDVSLDTFASPFQAPHVAAQTDVYLGKNAYFVSGLRISRHAAVSETCVGCHMAKQGADPTLTIQPASTNHSWRIDASGICSNCHGAGTVNGEAIKYAVEQTLGRIPPLAARYVMAKLDAAPFSAVFVDVPSDRSSSVWNSSTSKYDTIAVQVDTAANPVVSVQMEEGHGQIAAVVTFTSDVTIQAPAAAGGGALDTVTARTFEFQLGNAFTGSDKTTPRVFEVVTTKANYDAKNVTLVKGMWNYFLVHGDGSKGIHNPSFVTDVLSATEARVGTL